MNARVFDDRACTLGEGPLWHPERHQLFWFDILAGRLLSRDASRPLGWDMGEMASAAGWVDRETLLVATETGLRRLDIGSGEHEPVVPLEAENAVTRSNDGRADPQGGFWIGTMGKRAEEGAGGIWRFHRGVIERLHTGITVSNAICFAPDGRRAYFADTTKQRIMTQPLDADGWPDGAPEIFVDLRAEGLFPDGAVTDAAGGLWCAHWGAGSVTRYTAEGRADRTLRLPAMHTTCPAFGGAGLGTLFVTSAREGLAKPGAPDGLTYAVEPGIAGRPEPRVVL